MSKPETIPTVEMCEVYIWGCPKCVEENTLRDTSFVGNLNCDECGQEVEQGR